MNKLLVLLAACAVTSIAAKNYCGGTMIERDESSMMAEDNGQLIVTNKAGFPVQITVHPVSKSIPASTETLADGAQNVSIGQAGVCYMGLTIKTIGSGKVKDAEIFVSNKQECEKHRHLTIESKKRHDGGVILFAHWTHSAFYNQD